MTPTPAQPGFLFQPHDLPKIGPKAENAEKASRGLDRLSAAVSEHHDKTLAQDVETLISDKQIRALLEAAFANSPFLTASAALDPQYTRDLLVAGPDLAFSQIMETLKALRTGESPAKSEDELARELRKLKRKAALTAGFADIAGCWDVGGVTGRLSDFADGAIGAAAAHLLRQGAESGAFRLADKTHPEQGSGLIILGVGKLGAHELNYSSDIDLIVLFDRDRIKTDNPDDLQNQIVRLTRSLVGLLEERTADGYVFRTDLRLRPDPGSTPIALSTQAAETYYESMGQNWERAALIKARAVAGDTEAGNQFIDILRPFIWRRNLDFAAIQDIHSIKRQINAHRGGAKIALKGHNLKLGRGGIREIEFFAQTQQLIWGGREAELRIPETVKAIGVLKDFGQINDQTARDMISAYAFLRRAEHRLQMINDEQTHALPDDDDALLGVSHFMGYESTDAFSKDLLGHLTKVQTHYAALFEDAPSLGGEGEAGGNLVFTGGDVDPDTMQTLIGLGFNNPDRVDAQVRGWHHGRYRATRSARAREILTELMPTILDALGKTADPDAAFLRFDEFLSKLPAGIQLFSLFHSRPQLLELVAEIMGSAPRLAQRLARRPQILDGVLARNFFDPLPECKTLTGELEIALDQAHALEEVLDISRRWAKERKFQVGAHILLGTYEPAVAAQSLSGIAESLLTCLQPRVEADFASRHGRFDDEGGRHGTVTVAMGKLGSSELQPASDLDIIFLYDLAPGAEASDGKKPLVPSQYYARLSQRMINAITAPTSEGSLYEMDMRLRPSGAAGPIASNLSAFDQYHAEAAWTWEHMALTRARTVTGPQPLRVLIEDRIKSVLSRPRDAGQLLIDVADMRNRIDRDRHYDYLWEMKYQRGTIVDVEFIAQYLQLKHAHAHPAVLAQSTRKALENVRDLGLENSDAMNDLIEALNLWLGLQAVLRLAIPGRFEADKENMISKGLMQTMCRIGGVPNKAVLEDKIRSCAARVYDIYRDIIEVPASTRS